MSLACGICGALVARWQNMPGHYRRAHPEALDSLPEAIARHVPQRSTRLRLPAGPPQPRALPQRAGHPSLRPASGRVRALAAKPRDPHVASPAEQSNIFPNRTPKGFWPPAVEPVSSAARPAKPKPISWVPWALAAGVVLFLILGGSVEIGAGSARSGAGASRWVSGFRPEGAT